MKVFSTLPGLVEEIKTYTYPVKTKRVIYKDVCDEYRCLYINDVIENFGKLFMIIPYWLSESWVRTYMYTVEYIF